MPMIVGVKNFSPLIGNLYLELGDNSKAESDFNKSIELNSKSSNSYNNRGDEISKFQEIFQ